jgi:hypothetical protein
MTMELSPKGQQAREAGTPEQVRIGGFPSGGFQKREGSRKGRSDQRKAQTLFLDGAFFSSHHLNVAAAITSKAKAMGRMSP